jgi:hypothetical protein
MLYSAWLTSDLTFTKAQVASLYIPSCIVISFVLSPHLATACRRESQVATPCCKAARESPSYRIVVVDSCSRIHLPWHARWAGTSVLIGPLLLGLIMPYFRPYRGSEPVERVQSSEPAVSSATSRGCLPTSFSSLPRKSPQGMSTVSCRRSPMYSSSEGLQSLTCQPSLHPPLLPDQWQSIHLPHN